MIAHLTGTLFSKNASGIILDVQGVGYAVSVSTRTLESLPVEKEKISLYIHTHVTEGSIALYGFLKQDEKNIFLKLMTVSGIGPRVALQILSGLTLGDLIQAIVNKDLTRLQTLQGVGKKTAERIIIELKDKLEEMALYFVPTDSSNFPASTILTETLSALTNLGYPKPLAEKALNNSEVRAAQSVEEAIKKALMVLMKN